MELSKIARELIKEDASTLIDLKKIAKLIQAKTNGKLKYISNLRNSVKVSIMGNDDILEKVSRKGVYRIKKLGFVDTPKYLIDLVKDYSPPKGGTQSSQF